MPRSAFLAPALALLAALIVAGPALSALRLGTNDAEVLFGTINNDQLNGMGGNDQLRGKAGNDLYFFDDGWGSDTLVEKAGEGADTLNFRGVTAGDVTVHLVPEWVAVDPTWNRATGPGGEIVKLSYPTSTGAAPSVVENAIGAACDPGTSCHDAIVGGGGKNVLQPGGGSGDSLQDAGGWKDGASGRPGIPASNDVFKGFSRNTGTVQVVDWGGTDDVVDMRPFATEDVSIRPIDQDSNGTLESLQIVTGFTSQVVVYGHFGPYANLTSVGGQQGRIETIIFTDETITDSSVLQSLAAVSAEASSPKQARLAEAAEGLEQEAQELAAKHPPGLGIARSGTGAEPESGKEKRRATADAGKQQQETQGNSEEKSTQGTK